MGKRIAIICLLAFCCTANASMTPVKRGMLVQSVTNVTAYSASVTNEFNAAVDMPVIAVGATTNGMPLGWSAWLQRRTPQLLSWTNLANNTYYHAGFWVRFNQFGVNSSDQPVPSTWGSAAPLATLVYGANFSGARVAIDGGGNFWEGYGSPTETNMLTASLNTWYYVSMAWWCHTNLLDLRVAIGTLGSSLTNYITVDNLSKSPLLGITFGNYGNATLLSGRMTGFSLDTMTSFSDIAIPSDMIAPPSARSTFYIDTATGSDLNSGIYSTNAFASGFMFANLLRFGGAMGNPVPWINVADSTPALPSDPIAWNAGVMAGTIAANGDRILLNSDTAVLRTTNSIQLQAANTGIELGSSGTTKARITPWQVLSGFTQPDAGTYPHVWQAAYAVNGAVMWEDGKWMNNATNATMAGSYTYLEATPGSFYSDGTNVAFQPFGSTNPTSDGKTYEASWIMYQKDTLGKVWATVDFVGATANYIHDLKVWGNVFRNQVTGVWTNNYCFSINSDGPSAFGNLDLIAGGLHTFGAVGGATNLYRLVYNSTIGQGPPWLPNVGYNNCVEYPSAATNGTRRVYYIGVDASIDSVIGSASGVSGSGGFLSHTSGPNYENAYSAFSWSGCKGAISLSQQIAQPGAIVITNSECASITLYTNYATIDRTLVHGKLNGFIGSTFRNSIQNRTDDLTTGGICTGTWSLLGSTFDARNAIGNIDDLCILRSTGSSSFGVTNCAILLPENAGKVVFLLYSTNDVLNFDRNVYLPDATYVTSTNGTPLTWSQWQALGKDANSSTNGPCLDANYRPYAKTPAWNIGTELGPLTDYTGKLFQSRRTAGAYEYVTPNPRFLMQHR